MRKARYNSMYNNVKKFIRENIQLIDDFNWKELYRVAKATFTFPGEVSEMTEFLFDCGLDLFDGKYRLKEIPDGFLWGTSRTEFFIPEHITSIGAEAFANAKFTKITIPKNVKTIEYHAFCNCGDLNYVTINTTQLPEKETIGTFTNCEEIYQIRFSGTMDQWRAMKPTIELRIDTVVFCNDGAITYDEYGKEVRA